MYYGSNYYGGWYYNSWYYGGGATPPPPNPGTDTMASTSGSRGGYFVPEEMPRAEPRHRDTDDEEWMVLR